MSSSTSSAKSLSGSIKTNTLVVLLVILVALAGGGYFIWNKLTTEGRSEADKTFALVMDRTFGQNLWTRGNLKYNFITKTLLVNQVSIKLSGDQDADEMTIGQIEIKNPHNYDETKRILDLPSWVGQPKTILAESVKLTDIFVKTSYFIKESSLELIIKTIALDVPALEAATEKVEPGFLGFLYSLSLSGLTVDSFKFTVTKSYDPDIPSYMSFDRAKLTNFSFQSPNSEFLYQPGIMAIDRLKFSSLQLDGLKMTSDNSYDSVNLTQTSLKINNYEHWKADLLDLNGLALAFTNKNREKTDFTWTLAQLLVENADISNLFFEDFEMTAADLFTFPIALKSLKLTDSKFSSRAIGQINLGSYSFSGPIAARTLAPNLAHRIENLSYTLPTSEDAHFDLQDFVDLASFLDIKTLNLNADYSCQFDQTQSAFVCSGQPFLALDNLFSLNFDCSLSGMTPRLIEMINTTSISDFDDLIYVPRFAELTLNSYRIELNNDQLADKIIDFLISEDYASDKDELVADLLASVDYFFYDQLNIDDTPKLRNDIKNFILNPKKLVFEMKPNSPLVDLQYMEHNDLNLTVAFNDQTPSAIEFLAFEQPDDVAPPPVDQGDDTSISANNGSSVLIIPPDDSEELEQGEKEEVIQLSQEQLDSLSSEYEYFLADLLDYIFGDQNWQVEDGYYSPDNYYIATNITINLRRFLGVNQDVNIESINLYNASSAGLEQLTNSGNWNKNSAGPLFDQLAINNISCNFEAMAADSTNFSAKSLVFSDVSLKDSVGSSLPGILELLTHLKLGSVEVSEFVFDFLKSAPEKEINQASLNYFGLFGLKIGDESIKMPDPEDDPLGFIKQLGFDNVYFDDFSLYVSINNTLNEYKLRALTLNGWEGLYLANMVIEGSDYFYKSSDYTEPEVKVLLSRLAFYGFDLRTFFDRIQQANQNPNDYSKTFDSPVYAIYDDNSYMISDLLFPTIIYDNIETDGLSVDLDGFKFNLDRLRVTGPFKTPLAYGTMSSSYAGSVIVPRTLSGPYLEDLYMYARLFGKRNFPFNGNIALNYDPEKGNLVYKAYPLLQSEDLFNLELEFEVKGLATSLIESLSKISIYNTNRLNVTEGFDQVGLSNLRLNYSGPQLVKG
ncbi:MAG: hypothetical protein LBE31_10420, partial [Deltaproteobacteria bacterium]|nr:hypothetical protein [Deltaproteobacteria bacterium]